jgi:hypothetical protein
MHDRDAGRAFVARDRTRPELTRVALRYDARPPWDEPEWARRRSRTPWWLTLLIVVVSVWMAGWLLLSFISSLGISCGPQPCQDRADTGWFVLMGLEIAAVVLTVTAWVRPRWRYWGLLLGLALPPAVFFVVTGVFYPPHFSL